MGCKSCKDKKKRVSGKSKTSIRSPNPRKRPSFGETEDKWKGGDPFAPSPAAKKLERTWAGEDIPFEYRDSHQQTIADWGTEPDDEEEEEEGFIPFDNDEDCPDCYREFQADIHNMKVNKLAPEILRLEREKREYINNIENINKKLEAIKFYLNGLIAEGVDISYITDPLEADISNYLRSAEGNTQASAPLKD